MLYNCSDRGGRMKNSDKKKVLLFVDRMRVGGIQILLRDIYKYMNPQDVTLEFLVLDDGEQYPLEEEIRSLGATIYKLNGIWIRSLRGFKDYRKAMDAFFKEHHDYCAVHMNSGSKNFYFLYYARKYGIPIRIAHSHNTNFQSKSKAQILLGNILKVPMKRYATNYFACSEYAGEWLFGKKNVKNGKVTVLKNAIDLDSFEYRKEVRKRVREELGITNDTIVIGHVGRFTPQKNHTFLIDIFEELYKQNSKCILILAGIGELMEDCKKKVKQLGLEKQVMFLGFRSDVNDLLQAMDIFLMPSLYEGFPVTGIEAQASGLPCVFSDTITREANILKEVKYIGLDQDVKTWATEVLQLVGVADREGCKSMLKKQGFDIRDYVNTLKKYYIIDA